MTRIFTRLLVAAAIVAAADASGQAPGAIPSPGALSAEVVSDLPVVGLAQVTFRVSDLRRSHTFYETVLGLPRAFVLRDRTGKVASAFYKVNDDQYLELVPGLAPGGDQREARLVVQSSDLPRLRAFYAARGLEPGTIRTGLDGNPVFRIVAPNGFPVDFLQYAARSQQARLRGRLLAPTRISTRLLHAGTMVTDEATRAFFAKLGWGRTMPGLRGDYIETPATDRNLETKNPPLDPANPTTRTRYEREVSGATNHFALEIGDMHAAREQLKARGGYDDVRVRVAVGNSRRWLLHLFDPDGTRAELMSKDLVPDAIPAFSVMPPGPPAPPIVATQRGVYPWP